MLRFAVSCSNAGRWGPDDELGTLNLVTPEVRRHAAQLVREGIAVSLGRDLDTTQSAVNPRPAWHVMHHEVERPYACADSIHLQVHGLAMTHLDALSHMFLDGLGYNGRHQEQVVGQHGVSCASIYAQRDGIVSRGVLLDVAAAVGIPWLPPGFRIGVDLLNEAEHAAGVSAGPGDVLFVHTGLEARESAEGPENPAVRAGVDASCLPWLRERDVAVYSGDCIEPFPERYPRVPMPLHQIGMAAMGLVLLDCPRLTELVEMCGRLRRHEFMVTVAPLRIPGGTGPPVNPLAIF